MDKNSKQNRHTIVTKVDKKHSYSSATSDLNIEAFTIRDRLYHMAELYPNKVVYVFNKSGLELTYLDVKEKSVNLAKNFLSMNLRKGDKIAFLMPNTHELLLSYFASALIGLISVPLDADYGQNELEYMINKTKPKAIIVYNCSEYQQMISDMFPEIKSCSKNDFKSKKFDSLSHVILINDHSGQLKVDMYPGAWSYDKMLNNVINNIHENDFPFIDTDDLFAILFTSGTTAKPKGIMASQFSLLNNVNIYLKTINERPDEPNLEEVYCQTALMYHFGAMFAIFGCLFQENKKLVFPSYKLELKDILESIQKYKCDHLFCLSKIIINILNYPLVENFDLSSLKTISLGGQLVTSELLNRLKNELNIKHVGVFYGMTEIYIAVFNILNLKVFEPDTYKNSIGSLFPFIEAKIINPENGSIQPHNIEGELYIRGYNVTRGYFDDDCLTKNSLINGWLNTKDIVSMDENGQLSYKSRAKEIIPIRGERRLNVYPSHVEDCLLSHPNINEAVVFGIPVNEYEQELCAWIKLYKNDQDSSSSIDEIIKFCKGKLVDYKIPKYIKIVDQLPMNQNGKYLRSEMENRYKTELGI